MSRRCRSSLEERLRSNQSPATTMTMSTNDPRYPVGKFDRPATVSPADRVGMIAEIDRLPAALRSATAGLSDSQLDTPYREGGWTLRQVVHHAPDSHLNAYCRFKLALTEEEPTIKTYDEARWAELSDSRAPIDMSLTLLESLHQRWIILLRAIPDADWSKSFKHPEWGNIRLDTTLALYAWHGRHHLAHVTELKRQKGW